jgi:hydrogenase maturation protease
MRLVLAYGNPLRGDDGAGWRLADTLRGDPETEIVCVHQLAPELADRVRRADSVLFLDAAVGEAPGTVTARHLYPDPTVSELGHTMSPATLLYLTSTFYGCTPEATLVTIAGRDFGFGTGLSRPVAEALPAAELKAHEVLRQMTRVRTLAHAEGLR